MYLRNALIEALFSKAILLVLVEEDEADNNGEPLTITGHRIRKRNNGARCLHTYVIVVTLLVAVIGCIICLRLIERELLDKIPQVSRSYSFTGISLAYFYTQS